MRASAASASTFAFAAGAGPGPTSSREETTWPKSPCASISLNPSPVRGRRRMERESAVLPQNCGTVRDGRWLRAVWQSAAILVIATAIGFAVNAARPDKLAWFTDWSAQTRLAKTPQGESLAVSLDEARALFETQ